MRLPYRIVAAAVWLPLALAAADPVLYPGPEQVPAWAQQGRYRFARLDGGPIEILKTARSSWGMHFTPQQKEVLGKLYSTYRDRMIEKLEQANLNWVWITWSVGYSREDEAEQREQCRLLTARLHEKGFHVTAYMCAVSMFWESMFRNEPRSVRWTLFDARGVPYRYSGGRDPMRFIADVSNPEWLAYQKQRIGAALDAGVDAVFLDNTAAPEWGDNETTDRFIGQLRHFIREERHSPAPLLTNYGLAPERIGLNSNMEVFFGEYWMEPGVFGADQDVSNIRRMKYVRGVIPDWKPVISEYSRFHSGTRSTAWLSPKSAALGIAEAAAFRSAYAWDMEGPLDGALMSGDPSALETWKAIGRYNGFLKDHEDLYHGARGTSPIAVLLGGRPNFGWDRDETGLYDLLARNSVLFDILPPSALEDVHLAQYAAVVVPRAVNLNGAQKAMLDRYRQGGGKLCEDGDASVDKIRALAPGRLGLRVDGAPHVVANLTRLEGGARLAVHVLNYGPERPPEVRVRVDLDREFASAGARPRLLSPDSSARLSAARRTGAAVDFTVAGLDTYAVVVLE